MCFWSFPFWRQSYSSIFPYYGQFSVFPYFILFYVDIRLRFPFSEIRRKCLLSGNTDFITLTRGRNQKLTDLYFWQSTVWDSNKSPLPVFCAVRLVPQKKQKSTKKVCCHIFQEMLYDSLLVVFHFQRFSRLIKDLQYDNICSWFRVTIKLSVINNNNSDKNSNTNTLKGFVGLWSFQERKHSTASNSLLEWYFLLLQGNQLMKLL